MKRVKPLFAFGHGLSYTSFEIGKVTADKQVVKGNETISFTVSVKNTGKKAGAETVQLYVTDQASTLPRPVKELKAFQKVFLLPGESREVTLTLDKRSLSFFDDRLQQWVAEDGEFEARIGNSSGNIIRKLPFRFIND